MGILEQPKPEAQEGDQFELGLNKPPAKRRYEDYSDTEKRRLKASILAKRTTRDSYTKQEADFLAVDKEEWGDSDNYNPRE